MNGINVCNSKYFTFVITTLVLTWLLNGCGDSGDDAGPVEPNGEPLTNTLGGSVTGLTGTGLVLQNNGDALSIDANGSFTFPVGVVIYSSYNVTVLTQPSGQMCSINLYAGVGTMYENNIDDIEVTCTFSVTVSATKPKVLTFSWADQGALYYRIHGGNAPGGIISTNSVDVDISVHLHDWVNTDYYVSACDVNDKCTDSAKVSSASAMIDAIGYFKASNTETLDWFGYDVALSEDGLTMAVSANRESSHADGIDGDQADNRAADSGAVYIFVREGNVWTQQAYIKASNSGVNDYFGSSLDLSANGNTLAVGAYGEGSADGDPADNTAEYAGAVYVFGRSGSTWTQHAYLKASNLEANDFFGSSLALSAHGNTLAVGAHYENSGDINNQADNSAILSGAVYVFARGGSLGTQWTQQAYLKASTIEMGDYFGETLAISAYGDTLVVGVQGEDSAATGIDGDEADNTADSSGAVYVFTRSGTTWGQQAYLKASNSETYDLFGASLDISDNGNTVAVGAITEDSAAMGSGGNQLDNSAIHSGAVYIFERAGTSWSQQAYLKASNSQMGVSFGSSVAMTSDGNGLAVGSRYEQSLAKGVNGSQLNDDYSSGAVYYFIRRGTNWGQKTYIKAPNTGRSDGFGTSLAISSNGSTLAVGADGEQSLAKGINGNQLDDSLPNAGAVYLY